MVKRVILFLSAALIVSTCATNPVTKKKEVVFMSEEQEIAMGKEADPQIIAQYGLYEDKELQEFFNSMGQEIVKVSHRPNIEYHFRVLDSDVLNAFALPGGYVYFTRGILAHFNNEAQLAGVLGHEIGHIAARHTVEQHRNQIAGQGAIIGGVILAPDLAGLAQPASQGLGLLFLKFGRDAERESDRLGVEYSTKTGYDAQQMADFFTTLERSSARSGQGEIPEFLSTHPNPGDRHKTVSKLAEEWKKKQGLKDPKVVRNSYLKRIDGIVYGEDPRQGYRENDVFYHPQLKFQFKTPQGWLYQNTPTQVQLGDKEGKAMVIMTMAKGSSADEAAKSFVQQNELVAQDARNVEVNGLKAVAVLADSKPQEGAQQIRTLLYFIEYGEYVYLLAGLSSLPDYQAYSGLFQSTLSSFSALSDEEKINRKPERISVKSVAKAGTVEAALRALGTEENRFEELAIVNGMQLTDKIQQGTLIKVITR